MPIDATRIQQMLSSQLSAFDAQPLGSEILKIAVPNPRYLHDQIVITIRDLGDGRYELTDAGELFFTFSDEAHGLVDTLRCAGAPVTPRDGSVVHVVDDLLDLEHTVMSFAHAITSAPLVWSALKCTEEAEPAKRQTRSAVQVMARNCKARVAERVPKAKNFIRLDQRLKERDDETTVPFSLQLTPSGAPRLMAGFVPSGAPGRMAKQSNAWLWTVAKQLTVPKYVVVEDADQVDHLAEMYDQWQVNVIAASADEQLVDDVAEALAGI